MSDCGYVVERLRFDDVVLDEIALPGGRLRITLGLGSGLAIRPGDAPSRVWAVGDRGPNLTPAQAVYDWGLTALAPLRGQRRAKIMPRPDLGPVLVELRVEGDKVKVVRRLPLRTDDGREVSGLPPPTDAEGEREVAFGLDGARLPPDPGGADSEGLAALPDGDFWVSEEYGPSLLKLDTEGRVLVRWTPAGVRPPADLGYPVHDLLPAIAARRRPNRGFEGLSASADGRRLFVAFQSALGEDGGGGDAGFARLWTLDADTGAVLAQHLYPFDPPESFRRDTAAGPVGTGDLKICETVWLGPERLLVLERMSHTAKIYRVNLAGRALAPEHLDETTPALETLSGAELAAAGVPVLDKTLLLSTDDAESIAPDLEGMAALSDRELLLVNDNDFGIEGVETRFFRVRFDAPVLA